MKRSSPLVFILLLLLATPALAEWMIAFNLKSRYLKQQ